MTTAIKARPTTYNGIAMRSRLEARVAAWLDQERIVWQYEPHAFASGDKQYLPDFRLEGIRDPAGSLATWYLEVKGQLPENVGEMAERLAIVYRSEPKAGVIFADEKMLAVGLVAVVPTLHIGFLTRCPCGNVIFAIEYGPQNTVAARCSSDCEGVGWRRGDDLDPRLKLPAYVPEPRQPMRRIKLEEILP